MTKNFHLAKDISNISDKIIKANAGVPAFKTSFRTRATTSNNIDKCLRDVVTVNNGGFFNEVSSRFESPVDGFYFFSIQASFGPGIALFELRINSTTQATVYKNTMEEMSPMSLTSIEHIAAGDLVEIYNRGTPHTADNSFIGCGNLIG